MIRNSAGTTQEIWTEQQYFMFKRLSSDQSVFVSEKKLIETLLKTTEIIRKHEQTWSNPSRLWSQAQFLTSILSEQISSSSWYRMLEVRTDYASKGIDFRNAESSKM